MQQPKNQITFIPSLGLPSSVWLRSASRVIPNLFLNVVMVQTDGRWKRWPACLPNHSVADRLCDTRTHVVTPAMSSIGDMSISIVGSPVIQVSSFEMTKCWLVACLVPCPVATVWPFDNRYYRQKIKSTSWFSRQSPPWGTHSVLPNIITPRAQFKHVIGVWDANTIHVEEACNQHILHTARTPLLVNDGRFQDCWAVDMFLAQSLPQARRGSQKHRIVWGACFHVSLKLSLPST